MTGYWAYRCQTGLWRLWEGYREKILYTLVGGSVFAFGTFLVVFLVEVLRLEPNFSNVVELVVTFQLNYILQARFTFASRRAATQTVYLERLAQFNLTRAIIAAGEWGLMTALNWSGIFYLVSNITAVLVGFVVGYFVVRRIFVVEKGG